MKLNKKVRDNENEGYSFRKELKEEIRILIYTMYE